MILPRNKLSRFERVNKTNTSRGPSMADLINEAASREAAAEIPAVAPMATAAPKLPIVKAKAKPAKRVLPKSAPPDPSPWYEEMLGWRGRGPRPPCHYDDGVRYETIHEYDPLERAEGEEDYDADC